MKKEKRDKRQAVILLTEVRTAAISLNHQLDLKQGIFGNLINISPDNSGVINGPGWLISGSK